MVEGEVNHDERTKAPKFQELNFKNWKKFFMAFLMRHDRAHLSITMENPATLITPRELKKLAPGDREKIKKSIKRRPVTL